nr:hypothetical protein [Mycoplasmopsis bovis]
MELLIPNGASSNSTNAQKTDEKEIKETSDSALKKMEKRFQINIK